MRQSSMRQRTISQVDDKGRKTYNSDYDEEYDEHQTEGVFTGKKILIFLSIISLFAAIVMIFFICQKCSGPDANQMMVPAGECPGDRPVPAGKCNPKYCNFTASSLDSPNWGTCTPKQELRRCDKCLILVAEIVALVDVVTAIVVGIFCRRMVELVC